MSDDDHALAGPYALGALADETERLAFEEHLARCEVCAEEVGGLLATSAVLGRAVALPPPAALRDRVLAEIGRVPQAPRASARPAPASPGQAPPDSAHRPARPETARPGGTGPARRPVRRLVRLPSGRSRLAAAGLAAGLLVAVGAGAVAVRAQQRLDEVRAADRSIAAVLSAPDARTRTGAAPGGGTVTMVVSASRQRVVVASTGLLALPASKTYELWTMGASGVRPAGLLRADATGHIRPSVASVPPGADRVGMTVEPAGGSPQPTTQPIVVLTI
ncbi:anti-sigma factor [Actinomadura scrupuli]|uniref:anti-sigma factor n=1 Tax=Actinomadura scrupuli TaxID=559629 RepID=UPI003D95F425